MCQACERSYGRKRQLLSFTAGLVSFQRRKCPDLRLGNQVDLEVQDVSVMEDPKRKLKRQMQKRLDALQCDCKQEWYIDSTAVGSTLCLCGSDVHRLELFEVFPLLADTARLKEDEFRDYARRNKAAWTAQPLSDFLYDFVDEHMDLVRHRNRVEYARYDAQMKRKEQEKAMRNEVSNHIRRTRRRSTTVALEYQVAFEQGQDQAEQIYVDLCRHLIDKVPQHNLDLHRLEGADAKDAQKLLAAAVKINERRQQPWDLWEKTLDSWKRDDSEKEKELLATILSHRRDIHDAFMLREKEPDLETRQSELEREIESFFSKIRQAFVRPDVHQRRLDDMEREVERARSQYLEIVEP